MLASGESPFAVASCLGVENFFHALLEQARDEFFGEIGL